jgi:hypothetical protein
MRIRKRETIPTIVCAPGDTITLIYTDELGIDHRVIEDTIDRQMTFTEAIIFDVDEALREELGITDGIGGLFVER